MNPIETVMFSVQNTYDNISFNSDALYSVKRRLLLGHVHRLKNHDPALHKIKYVGRAFGRSGQSAAGRGRVN